MSTDTEVRGTVRGFEAVMEVTDRISSHVSFELDECRCYYNLLRQLPTDARVLEIGLQFGRSSSIALQVAEDHHLRYYGIDPFIDPPNARGEWMEMNERYAVDSTVYVMKSEDAAKCEYFPSYFNLALIDGDHNEGGVRQDCEIVMPRMLRGGYALFHDYGRESLPNVYPTVRAAMIESIMQGKGWREIGVVGTLGIWQRL